MQHAHLWAKWPKTGNEDGYHPVACHLIDVAACFSAIWPALGPLYRKWICDRLQLCEDSAQKTLCYWIGLHDIGKISPAFQMLVPAAAAQVKGAGFTYPRRKLPAGTRIPHSLVSQIALSEWLEVSKSWRRPVATAIGAHHGSLYTASQETAARDRPRHIGSDEWHDARREVAALLMELTGAFPFESRIPASHELMMVLAGLTSLADWCGSMSEHFPFANHVSDFEAYANAARKTASRIMDQLGWAHTEPRSTGTFAQSFGFQPRPLQSLIEATKVEPGSLLVIEAPTGEGKTEAGLFVAERMMLAGQRGFYVALPTMATANQMFGRVRNYLARRFDLPVQLQLLHGRAAMSAELAELLDVDRDGGDSVYAASWFANRKRRLAASVGVGTVDQVMLAALQTRHGFVRLACLNCRTVVIDEVHAYDVYMSVILERLLSWLRAMDCTVVMLSATLPVLQRKNMVEAWQQSASESEMPDPEYPRLTIVSPDSKVEKYHFVAATPRTVQLRWTSSVIQQVQQEVADGGVAAVICSTVSQSQQIYDEFTRLYPDETQLLHSRFTAVRRLEIETQVIEQLQPGGQRPDRLILVATQVIEQSLDIDLDVMVSMLCPVDLLIQRIGRLWRHEREDRPAVITQPICYVVSPELNEEGVPDFGESGKVYSAFLLLQTWLHVRDRTKIQLPSDLDELIEAVYSENEGDNVPEELSDLWFSSKDNLRKKLELDSSLAQNAVIKRPNYSQGLSGVVRDEASPEIMALTRLGLVSVEVACLTADTASWCDSRPDHQRTNRILKQTVRVSGGWANLLLKDASQPVAWSDSALLRNHRAVMFDVNGEATIANLRLVLSNDRGLALEVNR